METKPKIHDNIVKYFLSDRENAISVIRAMLPPQVQEHLELESIRYENDSFIPKHLKEYYSDLLTSVPIKDQNTDAKVYFLLEHKSTYKETTPLHPADTNFCGSCSPKNISYICVYLCDLWEKIL